MSRRKNLALAAALCLLLAVPAQATDVEAVSVPAPGVPSDTAGGSSFGAVSADGRFVVFESSAGNVIPGQIEHNASTDIFLHDRIAGTTVLVSHRADDPQGTGSEASHLPVISSDGRYVAYISFASDLVAGQVDAGERDTFLYDRVTGTTSLVSHVAGLPTEAADQIAISAGISGDGRWIVHINRGVNLVDGQIDDGVSLDVFLYDRDTGTNTLVSHTSSSLETAVSSSLGDAVISADGLWVAFESAASNLVAGQTGMPARNVFLYSRASGTNVLASHVSSSATTTGSLDASKSAISADGSWIAFSSASTDLVAGQADTNGFTDVFLYERATGTNTLVSRTSSSATTAGNSLSDMGTLSGDGRYVAFTSVASDLAAGVADTGGLRDIFLHDRVTGTTTLVSHAGGSTGTPANGMSSTPVISADGAFVAFLSQATNGVSGQVDTNGWEDVFLYDRATGSLALASHAAGSAVTAGSQPSWGLPRLTLSSDGAWLAYDSLADDLSGANDANVSTDSIFYERQTGSNTVASLRIGAASATAPGTLSPWPASSLSNDGRYVAFESAAPNLVPGQTDANGSEDVFLRDRLTGQTRLVSHGQGGALGTGDGASLEAAASADGSSVVFASRATDLVAGQVTNAPINLFHWARGSGTVTLVNRSAASPVETGNAGLQQLSSHGMSGDGRWIVYHSFDTNLVAGQTDLNATVDVFLFDLATGTTTLVSRSAASPTQAGNGASGSPAISDDGRWIAFRSGASDLVPGQTGAGGIFLYDRITGATVRVSPDGQDVEISGDGRWVAFESWAADLFPGQVDTNSLPDLFLWDRVSGTTTLVSRSASSPVTAANSDSSFGSWSSTADIFSADGRYLVFASDATDLVAGQTENNQGEDVFLFDRITGSVTLVSRCGSPEVTGNGGSFAPAISADGSKVAFMSHATDLVPSYDPWNDADVFVYDRAAGSLVLASHKPFLPGHAGDFDRNSVFAPRISADGQVVAFSSLDESLVFSDLDGHNGAFVHAGPLPGQDFFTATPCRVLDTRQQGPALAAGVERTFAVEGLCGIPATARAVVVNVTAVQPSGAGHVVLHPGDLASPLTSTINFAAGATRANNAILPLAFDGTGTLAATPSVTGGGTVHLILDVSGWFE